MFRRVCMSDGSDNEPPTYPPPVAPFRPPPEGDPLTGYPPPERPPPPAHRQPESVPPPADYLPPQNYLPPEPYPSPETYAEQPLSPSNPDGSSALKVGIVVGALVACVVAFLGVRMLVGDASEPGTIQSVTEGDEADGEGATGASGDVEAGDSETGRAVSPAEDDLDCVLASIDEDFLPPPVASLEELYTIPVSNAASLAFAEADFACHPDPVGSSAYIEGLRANLELALVFIEVDTAEARCVTQSIVDNHEDGARIIAVGGEAGDFEALRQGMVTCFDAEDVAYLNREPGSGPQAYGDHPAFDALYDECAGGDNRTCDLLWVDASEGSDYAALAFDCAGRGTSVSGLCTPDIELDADEFAVVTSPGFVQLVEECRDGDATSCDLVATISPPGSKSEAVGYNCGGQVVGTALPDCRTVLGDG